MSRDDAALDLVACLAAWPGTPSRLNFDVTEIQLEALLRFCVENGNGHRRSLDATSFLVRGHSLVSMTPSFVSEERFGSLALEEDSNESWTVV